MTEPQSKAQRRRPLWLRSLRVAAKVLLWLVGILLGLVVLAWLAIWVFFPDEKIKRMALEEIGERTGLSVTAAALDLEILSGLVLEDVRVSAPPGFERPPLTIERIVVDYSLADLLDDRIEIRSLHVDRPRLTLEWRDGRSNLQAMLQQIRDHRAASAGEREEPAGASGAAGEPFRIALEAVSFSRAQVDLDAPGGVRLALDGLAGQVSGLVAGPEQSRLKVGVQLVPGEQPAVHIAPVGLEAKLGLDVNAKLNGFDSISAAGQVQLENVSAAALGAETVDLRASFEIALDLQPLRLRISPLRVELDGRELLAAEAALPALDAGLVYELNIGRLDLGHPSLLRLAGPWLTLAGQAQITDAVVSGDLGDLINSQLVVPLAFDGLGIASGGMRLAGGEGRLTLRVAAQAEGWQRASISGSLRATAVDVGGLSVEQPHVVVGAVTRLPAPGQPFGLQAPVLKIDGGVARVRNGPVSVEGTTFSAELKARVVEDPGPAATLVQPALALDGSAEVARVVGVRLIRPRLQVGASAARLRRRTGAAGVTEPNVHLEASAGQALVRGLRVSRPGLDLRVTGSQHTLGPDFARPLRLRGRLTTGPVAPSPGGAPVPPGSGIDSVAVDLDTRLTGLAPSRLPLALSVEIDRPRVGRPNDRPAWALGGPVRLSLGGDLRPATGRLSLERFQARIADILEIQAKGWFDARAPAMKVDFTTSEHGLADLVAALPEDIRAHVPAMTGKVRLAGRFDGPLRIARDYRRLPFSVDLTVDNIGVGLDVPQAGLALSGLRGPVRLSAGPAFDDQVRSTAKLELDGARLGGEALSASGVTVELASNLAGDQLKADGWATAARLRLGDVLPEPISRVRLDFASMLTGFKDLRLTDFSLALGSLGLTSTGQGQILLTPGSGHIGEVRLSLQTRSRFASQRAVALPGGLSIKGGAGFSMGVRSVEAGVLRAEGRMTFEDFSLFGSGFAFEGASGSVPVLQYVRVQPTPGLLARGQGSRLARDQHQQRSKAYEQALRPLKGQARSFTIHKVSFKDLVFTDMSGNLELNAGVLSLGSLRFGFLDGDVVADTTVVFAPPEQRRLTLDAEMSGIDLSGLGALNLAGTSDVSGNLRLGLDWNQRDVTTAFNLTRIGRSTLQALLTALDPKEANPGLVALRGFLDRYEVSPREVNLDMRHGLLSLRTRLQMGSLARAAAGFVQGFSGDTFALTHIPVGSILSKYLDFGE